jgi:hypothetical protein
VLVHHCMAWRVRGTSAASRLLEAALGPRLRCARRLQGCSHFFSALLTDPKRIYFCGRIVGEGS